jgi:hypothetical protein
MVQENGLLKTIDYDTDGEAEKWVNPSKSGEEFGRLQIPDLIFYD